MSDTSISVTVISIGAMAANDMWKEKQPVRTAHSTTTLIISGENRILIDPALPAAALEQRLAERTALKPADITDIFLTCWRPAHRRALKLFADARWWMGEAERQTARAMLQTTSEKIGPQRDEARVMVDEDLAQLARTADAPDKLAAGVDLFPLAGFTPGQAGLIVSMPESTLVIAGGAVATREHFLAGRVPPDCYDAKAALASLSEIYEIADAIIPGYDNQFNNPRTYTGAEGLFPSAGLELDL